MVAITQRDLPYMVLTYDANLQAYRTDTVANVEPVLSRGRHRGHHLRAGRLRAAAVDHAGGGGGSDEGGGQSPGLAIVAAIVFGVGGWFFGSRQSRRRETRAAGGRGMRGGR